MLYAAYSIYLLLLLLLSFYGELCNSLFCSSYLTPTMAIIQFHIYILNVH